MTPFSSVCTPLLLSPVLGSRNRQREADVDSDLSAGSRRRRSDVDVGCF